MGRVLGVLRSFLDSPVSVAEGVNNRERRLHIADTVSLGREQEILTYFSVNDNESWTFDQLDAVKHNIEIDGNHAVILQEHLESYSVQPDGVVEYISGHERYTVLPVGPLYFTSSYHGSDLSIRVWPYETTFYGGAIEKTNIHFHVSVRSLRH